MFSSKAFWRVSFCSFNFLTSSSEILPSKSLTILSEEAIKETLETLIDRELIYNKAKSEIGDLSITKQNEILKEEISPVGYKTYVEVMIPRLSDENTVCFLAPSNYHIEVVTKKYLDLISNTLSFLTNKNFIINFESKEMLISDDSLEPNFVKGDLLIVNQ